MNSLLLTGFLLGFLGSFHCVVMCGPVVLSLPVHNNSKKDFLTGRILYNAGRVMVYSLMGFVLGLAGERIVIAGFQQVFSIITGIIIIAFIIKPFIWKNKKEKLVQINIGRFKYLKEMIGRLYSNSSKLSIFVLGVMNGFLPCGFVYIALTASASVGSAYKASLFMMLFGIGTIPLLLVLALTGKSIRMNFRRTLNKYSPIFAVILALIFIIRGLNLGIPYLSPKMDFAKVNTQTVICH